MWRGSEPRAEASGCVTHTGSLAPHSALHYYHARVSDPLAYFLTFVAYGSWLHGDERGSVDNRAASPDLPREQPNPGWREWERARFGGDEIRFNARWRFELDAAFRERCEFAGWRVIALNIRTNHVHMVVSSESAPERVMTSLKAWGTRRLVSEGLVAPGGKVWARHGSTHYLWKDHDVEAAVDYVLHRQGAALPMEAG